MNQYIRERSLGEWAPRLGQATTNNLGKAVVQTRASREAMCRRLIEFLRWCDKTGKNWTEVDYGNDLLGTWQTGLLTGTLSTSRRKLSNGTVNVLVSEAAYFLTWAADRKYREPFSVTVNTAKVTRSSGNHTQSGAKVAVVTRMGTLTPVPDFVMLPTDDEIKKWLNEVHYLRGPVKRLTCETICRTGMRIQECCQLLVSDIPQKIDGQWPRDKVLNDALKVRVHVGNKGRKVSPGSMESAKPRDVYLPIDLAERIYEYLQGLRSTLILRGIDRVSDKAERQRRLRAPKPIRLWVGEKYGLPFTSNMLYKAWTSVPSCPKGWHPHVGREFYAVETMVKYAKDLIEARGVFQVCGVNHLGWLDSLLSNQIKVILSPLMGHISEETTHLYLRKMKHRLIEVMGHPAIAWTEICAEEDGEIEEGDHE